MRLFPRGSRYAEGAYMPVPQTESDVPGDWPQEYQSIALRGVYRRRELDHLAEQTELTDEIIFRDRHIGELETNQAELSVSAALKGEKIAELTHASELDPKTGLLNSIAFREHVMKMLGDERRKQPADADNYLLFLDLDDFKAWNSLYTETVNDGITLIPTAQKIRGSTREGSDYACRTGGEEFILFISHITHDDLRAYIHRLKADINGLETPATPVGIDHLGVSIGYSKVADAAGYDAALQLANLAEKYVKKHVPGKDAVKDAVELTAEEIAHLSVDVD